MLQMEALIRHILHVEPAEDWDAFARQVAQAEWVLRHLRGER